MILFTLDEKRQNEALSLLSMEPIFTNVKVAAECEWPLTLILSGRQKIIARMPGFFSHFSGACFNSYFSFFFTVELNQFNKIYFYEFTTEQT